MSEMKIANAVVPVVAAGPVVAEAVVPREIPARPWPVFWVTCIAVFLVSLDGTLLFAAFGTLREGFPGVAAADLSWVLNAYSVVFAAMLIPGGGLADRFGRKRIFLAGVALFLAASLACGLAPDIHALIAARVLQAAGAALLTPASLSLVLDAFPKSRRAVVVSLWGAVGALAAATGPGLGSLAVDTLGWPWAFYLNLPLGLFSLWKGRGVLQESAPSAAPRPLDWTGMSLLILGVGSLALVIVQLDSVHWSARELSYVGIAALITLLGFVGWTRSAKAPLVDPALFHDRTYRYVNIATLVFGTAFSMMFFTFFFFVTEVWHFSLPRAGIAITPGPLMVMPTAILVGRLAGRYGHRPFLVGGALVYACSGLWFLLVPGVEPHYARDWLPGLLLSGIAVGMVLPSLSGAAVAHLSVQHYAVGSAFNQATRQIGSVLGVAITVLLLGASPLARGDFTPLYLSHVGLALLTGLLCLPVDTRPAPSAPR